MLLGRKEIWFSDSLQQDWAAPLKTIVFFKKRFG